MMGGFIIFSEGQAWAVSNAAWRATITPAAELLAPQSEARQNVEQAIKGGIHYLDLQDTRPGARADIQRAFEQVRERYANGQLVWSSRTDPDALVHCLDALIAMFDDPKLGRPLWKPPPR